MDAEKNIGLIECNKTGTLSKLDERMMGSIRKVLIKNDAGMQAVRQQYYPNAEIVHDTGSIINDESIQLVIINDPENKDLTLISKVLEAGKLVRVL